METARARRRREQAELEALPAVVAQLRVELAAETARADANEATAKRATARAVKAEKALAEATKPSAPTEADKASTTTSKGSTP